MSDRMSVSLNWERLCIVCEREAEELSREETSGGGRRARDEVAQCLNGRHMDSVLSSVSVKENECEMMLEPNRLKRGMKTCQQVRGN